MKFEISKEVQVSNQTINHRLTNLTPAKLALLKLKLVKNQESTSSRNPYVSIHQKLSESAFADAYTRFIVWQSEFKSRENSCIDRHLVHKDREENVLISRLEKLHDDFIIGEVHQNLSHNFFYEHPKDHVPGLYILEAARQFGTALSHLYFNVPFGTSFILNDLQAQFYRFAETIIPLYIVAKISDKVYAGNKLSQLLNHAFLVQNEQVIAEVTGNFKIFESTSYNNIRNRAPSCHLPSVLINTK